MNQSYFKLLDMISQKVNKDDLMFNGFDSIYGNTILRPPVMDYAHGDYRTIHIGWIPPLYYTKTSHYLVQVSDDNVRWRGLCFNGSSFGYEEGTSTTVYSNVIAHTRIPFIDDNIQILYYRTATVSKDGQISEWSESIVGNTFFVEQSDIRGENFNYPAQGTLIMDSEFDTGQFDYVAEGGITISGEASWDGYVDYIAYIGTGEINISSTKEYNQYIDLVKQASGSISSSGLFWTYTNIKYYLIDNIHNQSLTLTNVIYTRGGSPQTVILTAGGKTKHYGTLTSQMVALETNNYIETTLYNEDW